MKDSRIIIHPEKHIDAIALVIFLNCQAINLILTAIIPEFDNLGLPFVIACSVVLGLFKFNSFINIRIVLPFILILFYTASVIFCKSYVVLSLIEFIIYVITPFILATLDFSVRKFVKYTLILTSPGIFILNSVFSKTWHGGISMGVSYAFLTPITCAFIYYFRIRKYDQIPSKILFTVICGIDLVYFFEVLQYGSRGPAMSIVILVMLLAFFDYNNDVKKLHCKKKSLFVISCFAILAIMLYGNQLLGMVYSFLNDKGIKISIISKSYSLLMSNNIMNNRMDIYLKAIKLFVDKPLLGNGIDTFLGRTGVVYQHNLVLQLMDDGGLLLLCCVITPTVLGSISILRSEYYNNILAWFLLFIISVPGAMLSGDIWQKYTFWFFVAYSISKTNSIVRIARKRDLLC